MFISWLSIHELLHSLHTPIPSMSPIAWVAGVSNLRPAGHITSQVAMNAVPHKIVDFLKTLSDILCVCDHCHNVFNVWPKTTLLPVWPRDAKRLEAPGRGHGLPAHKY